MVLHGGRLLVVMKIIVLILFRKVTNWYNNFNLNLKQGLHNTFFLPLHTLDPFKPPTAPRDQCAQYWKEGQDFVNAHHAINAHNIERMSEFFERAQRDQRA